ncbi:hypothetical protein E2C01_043197 [Portunus trituberculatus]|uniref:Uncharacterized protein n=1 Tax=Portunus trituberculatus TaxID=210409 RepID=A0A5B7FWV8_PORTR|nr:hypothetical protein [Portunus trituberculatus]
MAGAVAVPGGAAAKALGLNNSLWPQSPLAALHPEQLRGSLHLPEQSLLGDPCRNSDIKHAGELMYSGGMPAAADAVEKLRPTVPLDIPKALTNEAPRELRAEPPDRVHTPPT